MRFKNLQNGYTEETSMTFLWVLLFGVFFFLYKKIWYHFFLSLGLGIITTGISWFIYPFYGKGIVRQHYLRNGWVEVSETGEEIDSCINERNKTGDYVILAVIIILAVVTILIQYSM